MELNKYMNGFNDELKRNAAEKAADMDFKFNHDEAYSDEVKKQYLQECVDDGIFDDMDDAIEAVAAFKLRDVILKKHGK